MKAEPLKKELYERAKSLGATAIVLHFSGGSDEGFLEVELQGLDYAGEGKSLWGEVEDWAWEVYEYSGAGDGTTYGDDITYDLVANKVSSQEWYHAVSYEEMEYDTLETR